MSKIDKKCWGQVTDPEDRRKFQKIVTTLTTFDEVTGRHKRGKDDEIDHIKRKMIVSSLPEQLKIYLSPLHGFVYLIVVRFPAYDGAELETMWMHEDGIALERSNINDNPDHPCFGITCIQDLIEKLTPIEDPTLKELSDEILFRRP